MDVSGWGGGGAQHTGKREESEGEVTEEEREGRSKEMPDRDLHRLYHLHCLQPCAYPLQCNEELRVKCERGEKGFYTHTPYTLTDKRMREREGGNEGRARERERCFTLT